MLRIAATLAVYAVVQAGLADDTPAGSQPPDAAAQTVLAENPATGGKAPAVDSRNEKTAPAVSTAAAEKDGSEEFKPPRGFKIKKRGDEVLYCQRDATVGTRFKTEKCYNQEQLRTYMMVTEAQRRDVDRIKTNCGGGPCTPYEPPMPR